MTNRRSSCSRIQLAQIEGVVAWNGGEVGIELVVGFGEQIAVSVSEDAGELCNERIKFGSRVSIEHDCQREVAQRLAVTQGAQAIAQIFNVSLLDSSTRTSRGFVFAGSLAIWETNPVFDRVNGAATLVYLFAGFVCRKRCPLRYDIEVGRDLSGARQAQAGVSR